MQTAHQAPSQWLPIRGDGKDSDRAGAEEVGIAGSPVNHFQLYVGNTVRGTNQESQLKKQWLKRKSPDDDKEDTVEMLED